ncbi:hypothetical protein [Geobacter sp. OR-1]|uniref:hypothetical protein n=1 Tax=Geobacter sp. OR-1 TaxID=1266765 RepID=UPI0005A7B4A3|nr:hypothetical protein [Geobacter sp. OR-1]
MKPDWHRGHVLGWFRTNCAGPPQRVFAAVREVSREFDKERLTANLAALGVSDGGLLEMLLDHFRRSYGEVTARGRLANTLFDPIMLHDQREGFELRVANRFYRIEKTPFPGCVDLRNLKFRVGGHLIKVSPDNNGRKGSHLEITMTDDVTASFIQRVKMIVSGNSNPEHKLFQLRGEIHDFCERARFARSAGPEVMELKRWLATKVRGLAGNNLGFKRLPDELIYQWHQHLDSRLHLPHPNFFYDPKTVTEEVYMTFFSPYREEM